MKIERNNDEKKERKSKKKTKKQHIKESGISSEDNEIEMKAGRKKAKWIMKYESYQ